MTLRLHFLHTDSDEFTGSPASPRTPRYRRDGPDDSCDAVDAAYHVQVVADLVHTQVPATDFRQLRDRLPESEADENWGKLFQLVDDGGWDETRGT